MIRFVPETALRHARIGSGLVMFAFVCSHLSNHALALVSLETAEKGRKWFSLLWLNPASSILLYGALLVHLVLVLRSIYLRRTLRMPLREALQTGLGLLIPFLIIGHAVNIRFSRILYGVDLGYPDIIRRLWVENPGAGAWQSFALLVIWTHGCIGVFFWLRYRDWYPRFSGFFLTFAVMLPILALLGFADAGRLLEEESARLSLPPGLAEYSQHPEYQRSPSQMENHIKSITTGAQALFASAVALVIAMRGLRAWRQRTGAIEIRYEHGAQVRVPAGLSILEASRIGGIPHYSVCGGKGRCSTCRVRILDSKGPLPPVGDIEKNTLRRIHADSDVRLGCQLRPTDNLSVALLVSHNQQSDLPPDTQTTRPGREEEIAVLFCDIRNFTSLSEAKLPYDVVFLLNRYFTIVGQAVEQAGGRLDKFIGDGAMALFGVEGKTEDACRNAMKAAATILRELSLLNEGLERQFSVRLEVVIGIHSGPTIVGVMGYGSAKTLTAIGDTVNVASRLESKAKELGVAIVVSEPAIIQAGQDIADLRNEKIAIRGRNSQLKVFLLSKEESERFL
ncbi:adenylate/guanylate cyclase domain-containing protein [Rhizobium sp. RM]|uniref:adenylate/guanylate cyclase domain-containing protein n=1 Tax=Rhizobium sp. RM TaxID=2748079 RepID=UPI00110F129F|nr:adenylate/guanylate cyclase domain-containing protein [Rhizobium sp. RM]NWJ23382.1 adenylate/guanylate cyclase domain-containing protein [Rhizobium sp. RM]TMV14247.1 adenylate/guanylate cyclase domain-containing protein [Rhizobium sp. Td3]